MQYKLLISPWKNEFINVINKTKEELFISSPFVNVKGVKILSDSIQTQFNVKISLITNMTMRNIIDDITEPKALLELYKRFGQVNISSLGRLHAKVYLIDSSVAIITSANLTSGGLINNLEYGVLIDDRDIVLTIKEDLLKYYSLGNIFDKNLLEKIAEEYEKFRRLRSKSDNVINKTRLAQLLRKSTEVLDIELLKNRIKGGKTISAIFFDTIMYLLKKNGPLNTKELHPLIQTIHPDICDDSIDRVINGQHFGKKWKHLVRSVQQSLKKNGLIHLKDGRWYLIN